MASPRRKAAADLTRGAWPHSTRALADTMSILHQEVSNVCRVQQDKESLSHVKATRRFDQTFMRVDTSNAGAICPQPYAYHH